MQVKRCERHLEWSDDWLEQTLNDLPSRFWDACERWRTLYRSALAQFEVQNSIIADTSKSYRDKQEAKRLRRRG